MCLSLRALQLVGVSLLQQRASVRHIISTYHSRREKTQEPIIHTLDLPLVPFTIQRSSASPLFSFGFELVRNCRANNQRISTVSFSNCNKGVLRLLELHRDSGKASFQIAGYVLNRRQTAQCDTLKEVEKIKRSILAIAMEYLG